ncbi:hypothetical protein DFH09DRAFT_1097989 [Mycena vulgaris]|nr:hypothetical protein DFH09DRAFT_1097989 [Mycena vulgaris]
MFPGYSRDTGRKNKYRADPRLKPHAKRIHRAAGVGGNKDYDTELDVFYWVLCALTPVLFKVKLQPPSDRNYATPVQRLCNAWQTPWQVSVPRRSNAMKPRPWHLPAV